LRLVLRRPKVALRVAIQAKELSSKCCCRLLVMRLVLQVAGEALGN
jgi:hypothetical protein